MHAPSYIQRPRSRYPGEPSVPRPPLTCLMLLAPLRPPQLVRYDNFYARTRVCPGVGTTSSPLLLRRARCPVAILSSDTRHSIPQSGMDRCTESAYPPPRLRAHADRMAPSSLLLKLIYIQKTSTMKRSSALAPARSRFAWAAAQPARSSRASTCPSLAPVLHFNPGESDQGPGSGAKEEQGRSKGAEGVGKTSQREGSRGEVGSVGGGMERGGDEG